MKYDQITDSIIWKMGKLTEKSEMEGTSGESIQSLDRYEVKKLSSVKTPDSSPVPQICSS
jgi:hypothetical protein